MWPCLCLCSFMLTWLPLTAQQRKTPNPILNVGRAADLSCCSIFGSLWYRSYCTLEMMTWFVLYAQVVYVLPLLHFYGQFMSVSSNNTTPQYQIHTMIYQNCIPERYTFTVSTVIPEWGLYILSRLYVANQMRWILALSHKSCFLSQ